MWKADQRGLTVLLGYMTSKAALLDYGSCHQRSTARDIASAVELLIYKMPAGSRTKPVGAVGHVCGSFQQAESIECLSEMCVKIQISVSQHGSMSQPDQDWHLIWVGLGVHRDWMGL